MHELSIADAVLKTATRHARGRSVTVVRLRVGRLRQVVGDSLLFYWPIVARGTVCEHARLELEEVEARLRCTACGREWEPEQAVFRCPACGGARVTVRAGDELEVDYIEVEALEAACTAPG